MKYVPRQRQFRLSWKIVTAAGILLLAMFFLLYYFVFRTPVHGDFQACNWDGDEMVRNLQEQQQETIELEDYLFYGETLALYMDPYDGSADPIIGKTLELVNVCSGKEYSFIVGDKVDRQIYLPDLDTGTYEIYLVDSFQRKRVVFRQATYSEPFDTIRRNGKVKRCQLMADRALLDAYGGSYAKHYAFLNVSEANPQEDTADVLIDPFGYYTTIWGGIDYGVQGNGIVEYEEAYAAAEELKEHLEQYGLRVILSRGSDELVEYYGKDGRAAKGYQAKAKYVISLGFVSGENRKGLESYHSYWSSPHLTNDIMYDIQQHSDIKGSTVSSSETSVNGVFSSYLIKGEDGRTIYDGNTMFREGGGKATFAGQMDERSRANAAYAQSNGMQGIEFALANVSDASDVKAYQKQKQDMLKAIADGFAHALDVPRP